MEKVQLKVYITPELRKSLYEFVKAKYESMHGGLSVEVQNAIAHWIGEQGLAAHTKTRINPGTPRVQAKIDEIIKWLRSKGFTNQFSMQSWRKACIHIVGSDNRTILKYLQLAKEIGKVKHYAGAVWEIV